MRDHIIKIMIVGILCGLYGIAWYTNIFSLLDFAYVQQSRDWLSALVATHYAYSSALFLGIYFLCVLMAIPGNFMLTMLGGYLFGPLIATLYVVVAATTGGTLCVLWVRYIMGRTIQKKYYSELRSFNDHIARYGTIYLFATRLFPFIPFVAINVLVGLTQISVRTFVWTTCAGIIPVVAIYAFLGQHLMELNSLSEIVTPAFLGAGVLLTVLGLAPLVIQRFVRA